MYERKEIRINGLLMSSYWSQTYLYLNKETYKNTEILVSLLKIESSTDCLQKIIVKFHIGSHLRLKFIVCKANNENQFVLDDEVVLSINICYIVKKIPRIINRFTVCNVFLNYL